MTFLHQIFREEFGYQWILETYKVVMVLIMMFVLIRFLPFLNKFYTLFYSIAMSIALGLTVCTLTLSVTPHSSWFLMSLFVTIPFVIIGILLVIGRYFLIFAKYKNVSEIKMNFFYCYTARDLATIVYHTKNKEELRSIVVNLITNLNFKKSKSVCHMFISIIIDKDVDIAHTIFNHAKNLTGAGLPDISFIMFYYENKLSELAYARNPDLMKIIKDLSRIRKMEANLKKLLSKVFQRLIDEEKVSFRGFSRLMSSLAEGKEYCENKYTKILKVYPKKDVYRKYANFLSNFVNDVKKSRECLNEANHIGENSTQTEGNIDFQVTTPTNDRRKRISLTVSEPMEQDNTLSPTTPTNSSNGSKDNSLKKEIIMENLTHSSDSFIGGGTATRSIYSNNSSMKSTRRSDYQILRKKVISSQYVSVLVLKFGLLVLFLVGMGLIISSFVLTFFMSIDFTSTAKLIDSGSDIRMHAVEVPYALRKLQVSTFPASITPLASERNTTYVRERAVLSCKELFEHSKEIYKGKGSKFWKEKILYLGEFKQQNYECGGGVTEPKEFKEYSLFDAVMSLRLRCEAILQLKDQDFSNTTCGYRLQDNGDFMFISYNEPIIFEGLKLMLRNLINIEETTSRNLRLVYFLWPIGFALFFVFFVFTFVYLKYEESRTFKALLLIPKEHSVKLFEKFGGDLEEVKDRGVLIKISIIPRAMIIILGFILFWVFVFIFFSWLSYFVSKRYDSRNSSIDQCFKTKVTTRKIHLLVTEMLYSETSMFGHSELLTRVDNEIDQLKSEFQILRFGDGHDVSGIDKNGEAFHIFYGDHSSEEECRLGYDPEVDGEEELFHFLHCFSLSNLIEIYIQSATYLLDSVKSGNYSSLLDLRKDHNFQKILQLDNNYEDHGVIQEEIDELAKQIINSLDYLVDIQSNLSLVLLLVGIPVFLLFFIMFFYWYPSKIKSSFIQPKEVLMLLPKVVIMKKEINEYLQNKRGFGKLFLETKKERAEEFLHLLKRANYPMIVTDKRLVSLFCNDKAVNLFGISPHNPRDIMEFFDKQGQERLQKWLKRKSLKFNGELVAVYEEQEFRVLVDITRYDGKILAIIENIEISKKKEILAAVEKKSKKVQELIENILPKEIAQKMSTENIVGQCYSQTYEKVTAIFADICNFTRISEQLGAEEIIVFLDNIFSGIDDLAIHYKVEKIKTIGDAYFAVSGLPTYSPLHTQIAMKFCVEIIRFVKLYGLKREMDLHMRIGMASGKVVAGVIGKIKWCYDVWGNAINMASRMEKFGKIDKIQVTRDVYASLFSDYVFVESELDIQGVGVVPVYIHSPKVDLNSEDLLEVNEKDNTRTPEIHREIVQRVLSKDNLKKKFSRSSTKSNLIKVISKMNVGGGEKKSQKKTVERKKKGGDHLSDDIDVNAINRSVTRILKGGVVNPEIRERLNSL